MKQFSKIAILVALNFSLAVCMVAVPFFWAEHIWQNESDVVIFGVAPLIRLSSAVLLVSFSNTIDAIVAFLFVLLAALLLVHRLFWPLLNRSVFRIQEIGANGRRAVLISIGLALLGTAANPTIIERVRKVTEILKG